MNINRQQTKAERLAMSAGDRTFELAYCHQVSPSTVRINYQFRAARCVMLRHSADKLLGETDDSFTVHAADDGRWLGSGDTKDEASGQARYRLMKESESAFEAGLAKGRDQ